MSSEILLRIIVGICASLFIGVGIDLNTAILWMPGVFIFLINLGFWKLN